MSIQIAIDGPSGSGKSTLAKGLSKKLGLVYVDTGALYRTVGLYARDNGIALEEIQKIVSCLDDITVGLTYTEEGQRVILNGKDVSDLIRTPDISMYASAASALPAVRRFLLEIQKKIAAKGNVVMDGRDIGTVIMPEADVKLFLESSPEARAHRRYLELLEKGVDCTEKDVLSDIIKRDAADRSRDVAPAVPAEDAIFLDNSELTLEETMEAALKIINEKLSRAH